MLTVLIVSVGVTLLVSGICSLMEAALYAVPFAYLKHIAEEGSRPGRLLVAMKQDIGKPIAAILILNTFAHTGGAWVAGWASSALFDERGALLMIFIFTALILYVSEILPKQVGVTYCRQVSLGMAYPLLISIKLLTPLIWISDFISRLVSGKKAEPAVSQEEFLSMTKMGTDEGVLDYFEGSVIKNVVGLDEVLVRDVLTPRVVVFRIPETKQLHELEEEIGNWTHSRVPVHAEDDVDKLSGFVIQRDIFRELLKGNRFTVVKDIARPLHVVPELMRADQLLLRMFEKREHISAVVDEHGSLAGIVTLEDIIEEIVGREIVDEYDAVSDLRLYAKLRGQKKKPKD